MNYELSKKLKDAGFPQKKSGIFAFDEVYETDEGNLITGNSAYKPSLSELIEACGEKFSFIEKQHGYENNLSWTALDYEGEYRTFGSTPELSLIHI